MLILKLNEWNLVGIKIFKNELEDSCKCILFINDEATTEFNTTIDVTEISNLVIASQTPITTSTTSSNKNNVTTSLSLPFKVCMMSFGSFNYTKEDMKAIYYEGLKYLVNSTPVQKATGVSYYNGRVYKDFDVITLNGSLESTRGNKPVALMKTDSSFKVEKARIFKYDPTIQRHVYGAFDDVNNLTYGNHSLLAYDLSLKNKGAISFKFKPEAPITSNYRYVVSSFKDESMKMGIFINSSNELRFAFAPKLLICRKLMEMGKWYTVTLFYSGKNISIYIDGEFFYDEELSDEIDLSDCVTYIGSDKDGTSALNGYVEVFAYSDKESNTQANIAKSIYENGNTISIRNHLDSLGRVKEKVIQTNKNEYKKTYSYDKLRVTREIEPDTHNIKYEYDSMGNITKKQYMIKDIVESESSYQYDKLGRLIKEIHPNGDIETFTYDANGNIITHQLSSSQGQLIDDETYHYSSINKDQLISITDGFTNNSIIKEYKYEDSYKGNPTSIITNGVRENLIWEGRKLKQVGDISFTYNEDGIRVKKLGTNFVERYILDGSKVIGLKRSHESGSYEMYFNYDEQGEITGVSCEGKEYFYIRDITGNITKIVDEEGRCVVSYSYDAWGNFKKTIYIDNYVSHNNPFVYKGYFFDSETGWFYLKSRYYDPTIRRFINADDFNYLDSESLTGINLYSYCGNSPVLGYDPEGTWSWKKFWCVVATKVVVAAVVTVVEVSIAAATESVVALDFSLSFGYFLNGKGGATILFDFKNERTELYTHNGGYLGNSKGIGFSYTASFVGNYKEEGGYKGPFIFEGATYNGYGVDHCFGPEPGDAYGIGVTIGTGKGFGCYVGYDEYKYCGGFNW